MDQYLNDDENAPLDAFGEAEAEPEREAAELSTPGDLGWNSGKQTSEEGSLLEAGPMVSEASDGSSEHWIEEEFSEDFEEGDGSWLMSLDDDTGDRPGFDPIAEDGEVEDFFGAGTLEASWQEEPQPVGFLQRTLVPLAALSVVALVGAAGWQVLEMRAVQTNAPEALPARFDLGPGRIIKPNATNNATPARRREVVGVVDPDSPNAARPKAIVRGSSSFASLSNPNTDRPNYLLAITAPDRAARAADERLARASDPTPDLGPNLITDASDAPPTVPELAGVNSRPLELEPLDSNGSMQSGVGSTVVSSEQPRSEVSGRWRRLLGLESEEGRARRRLAEELQRSDDGVVAQGPSYVREGEIETSTGLPYGLDAAFIPNWRPPMSTEEVVFDITKEPVGLVRSATWSDMVSVWSKSDIPIGAIEQPERLWTPSVGFVALTLDTGEVFTGRMHSVGQGRVWIQNDLGRTAIENKRIAQIASITAADAQENIGLVESLDRVRIRSAGGVLFGHVLAHDDERTTVVTDGGSRITVPNEQVDFVGTRADVLLKRS